MSFLVALVKRKKSKIIVGLCVFVTLSFYLKLVRNVDIQEKQKLDIIPSKILPKDFVFEQIDGYDYDKEANFFLISAKTINFQKLMLNYPKVTVNQQDVFDLINYLYDGQAFLLDINLIKNIKLFDNTKSIHDIKSDETNKIKIFEILKSISFVKNKEKIESAYILYGVFLSSFYNLHIKLRENIDQEKFYLNYTFSYYENEKILTGIYVKCDVLLIQIQIVYERGNFLWIGANDLQIKTSDKYFGDFPRALKKYRILLSKTIFV